MRGFFLNLMEAVKVQLWRGKGKKIILCLIGLFLVLKVTELGLNLWVRQVLRQSLLETSDPDTRLEAKVKWLSLSDFMAGRIRSIKLRGFRCRIGGIKLKQLQIDTDGFILDLNVLLQEKQFLIKKISPTVIQAQIDETAATEYFYLKYPHLKPTISFAPDRLKVTGEVETFGNLVPIRLEGKLQIIQPKTLRFYPEVLRISERFVPESFLKLIGNQVPLEVTVLRTWPLQIQNLTLQRKILALTIREIAI